MNQKLKLPHLSKQCIYNGFEAGETFYTTGPELAEIQDNDKTEGVGKKKLLTFLLRKQDYCHRLSSMYSAAASAGRFMNGQQNCLRVVNASFAVFANGEFHEFLVIICSLTIFWKDINLFVVLQLHLFYM